MSKELMQERVQRAFSEMESSGDRVGSGPMRQRYHFMGKTGWINDPNGLIYFRGRYHFFFQYNPYSGYWDTMYWGHAISENLVDWEYLPPALAPSEEYDDFKEGGCFSGSAIEHEGKLYLFYTGVSSNGRGPEQVQCVAYSEDGIHFEKYPGNPVLRAPEGVAKNQFRDPKVWKAGDTFYMVLVASLYGRGQALLYESPDLLSWTFKSVLSENLGEWGWMWECPDFFPLGDKYVLTCSPIGVGDHTTIYQVGDFDYGTGRFVCERAQEMDWGFEYYAPQSFLAPDGRRIMVAWANRWQWAPTWKDFGPTFREGWCGFFNLPREVRLGEDGRLCFIPVKELELLRMGERCLRVLDLDELEGIFKVEDPEAFETRFTIDLDRTDARKLELVLRESGDGYLMAVFDFQKGELRVERSQEDGWSEGISVSRLYLKGKKELDVHVFSDTISVEVFTDGYRNNHSNNIYSRNAMGQIRFNPMGGRVAIKDFELYGLRKAERTLLPS